jgi:hypothetical protein
MEEYDIKQKIQAKLALNYLPEIIITRRQLTDYYDREGLRCFESEGKLIGIPPGYYSGFTDYSELFKDEYIQLFYAMNHTEPHRVYFIRLEISDGKTVKPAGYQWVFMGTLRSRERFCATLYFMVSREFSDCGLSNILKLDEISFAKSERCDFIQTYHDKDNPDFYAAIIPELTYGFMACPGIQHKEELEGWNQGEFVHLRKYFNPATIEDSVVIFKDGASLKSPSQNQDIIRHLLRFRDLKFPGEAIAGVEYEI